MSKNMIAPFKGTTFQELFQNKNAKIFYTCQTGAAR